MKRGCYIRMRQKSMSMHIKIKIYLISFIAALVCSCGKNNPQPNPTPQGSPEIIDPAAAQREEVRRQNRDLVRLCATAMAPNKTVEVNYYSQDLCRLPNIYSGNWAKYRINKNSDESIGLNIRISANMRPSTSPERARQLIEQVRSCIPQLQQVFQRYNIQFTMDFDQAGAHTASYDHQINLYDEAGRSNATNWRHLRGYLFEWSSYLCVSTIHELGHLLSLPDEYEDPNCPNRPFISTESNPDSIMKSGNLDPEHQDFYPRHISAILWPACPTLR